MTQYKGYSSEQWARLLHTTIAEHIREQTPAHMRSYRLGALLEASGRISFNNTGNGFDWPVIYRFHDVEGNDGRTVRSFGQTNLWDTAYLNYRGYQATDSISNDELQANAGPEAIVRVMDNFGTRLDESIRNAMGKQWYIDGGLAANSKFWNGFESMFGTNGTVKVDDGTQRSANAADLVGYPSDTYAGLSTELGGAHGGSSNAPSGQAWPHGVADSEYDFWSPLIVNYTSTAFGGASDTFAAQGDEAMRFAIIHCQRNHNNKPVTNIMLDRSLYIDFLNLIDDKERVIVDKGNNAYSLTNFGFQDVVNFDGAEVSWETGVPANVGYGLNFNCMEVKCRTANFIELEGPEYDIHTQRYLAVACHRGNIKFETPRDFFKLAALA